jgi:hypothetical protein
MLSDASERSCGEEFLWMLFAGISFPQAADTYELLKYL